MSRFGSIEPVGILNAWTTNVRMNSASTTAMTSDSKYSRATDFLNGFHAHSPSVPIFSTARNASCGISTLPTRFMRFFPSFCFSSSLRLREMSPP